MKFLFLLIVFLFYFILFYLLFFFSYIRIFSFFGLSLLLLSCLMLLLFYNKSILWYQLIINWYHYEFLNISYIFGVDGFSITLIILCSFLIWTCLLMSFYLRYKIVLFIFLLFISLWILINIFCIMDVFFFYLFFEAITIPMFLIIYLWGSRARKTYAAFQFFLYTLFGSFFILISFLFIYFLKGSSSFDFFAISYTSNFRLFIIWIFLFIGFSVKIPIMPFHVWLPEAHVEAPTPGSVILAGILLKLGSYGIFRFLLYNFSVVYEDIIFIILIIGLIGFTYTSLIALNQIDIKKIIAYSSISHMNFSLLAFFSESIQGLMGVFILMIGHALTSSALFFGVGVLYDRYKTRIIFYYNSLVFFMPLFSVVFFIFILSNFGFPGTINFVGEFLISCGIMKLSSIFLIFTSFGMILTLIYSLFLYNRIFFGPLLSDNFIRYYSDLMRIEFYVLIIFILLIIIGGIYPNIVSLFIFSNINKLIIYI